MPDALCPQTPYAIDPAGMAVVVVYERGDIKLAVGYEQAEGAVVVVALSASGSTYIRALHAASAALEVGRGVDLRGRVVALERALEWASGARSRAANLALLRCTRAAKPITVADQLLVLLLASLFTAESPEQQAASRQDNGTTNTNADTDNGAASS